MPWFKIHDGFDNDPKILAAGNSAMGLWARCGAWSMKQLTDGHVPYEIARIYGKKRDIDRLVQVGLWLECEGGYRFRKWDKYQPLKQKVENDRAAAAERQRRSREVRQHA